MIAVAFGKWPGDVLQRPVREVQMMTRFVRKFPPGWRQEVATALNTAAMANIHRDPKKTRAFHVWDFSNVAKNLAGPLIERRESEAMYNWFFEHAQASHSHRDREGDQAHQG